MDLPKVKKQLWALLPSAGKVAGKAKQIGTGLLMVAIGAFASTTQATVPPADSSIVSVRRDEAPGGKLILQQPTPAPGPIAQHWSHSSHYSHSSHSSHYSHYSSRD